MQQVTVPPLRSTSVDPSGSIIWVGIMKCYKFRGYVLFITVRVSFPEYIEIEGCKILYVYLKRFMHCKDIISFRTVLILHLIYLLHFI